MCKWRHKRVPVRSNRGCATCCAVNFVNDHAVGPPLAHHALQSAQVGDWHAKWHTHAGVTAASPPEPPSRTALVAGAPAAVWTVPACCQSWTARTACPPSRLHLHCVKDARLQRPGSAVVACVNLHGTVAAMGGADVRQSRLAQSYRQAGRQTGRKGRCDCGGRNRSTERRPSTQRAVGSRHASNAPHKSKPRRSPGGPAMRMTLCSGRPKASGAPLEAP